VEEFFNQTNADYENTINYYGMDSSYLRYDLNITLESITTGAFDYSMGKTLPTQGNIGQTKKVVLVRDENTGDTALGIISVRVW
jgi:hypothetical protein